jgi:ribokinase
MTGKVIVVGSVNVDLTIAGLAELPRPGATVVGGTFERSQGGKGANQAAAAARLGAATSLVGVVGPDDLGAEALEDLRSRGVDVSFVSRGEDPTGVALIVVDGAGENLIAVASGANHELSGELVTDALARLALEGDVVVAVLEVPDEAVAAAAAASERSGATFVLNPAPARRLDARLLSRCDWIVPNQNEAELLGGPEELVAGGAGTVIVTRGGDGADLYGPDGARLHQPPFEVEVVDTTGAGDAFTAALAWALSEGAAPPRALALAAAAGALSTRAAGARGSLPDGAEVTALAGVDLAAARRRVP